MNKKAILYLTRGAMIAACYVVLTYVANLFGLANGEIGYILTPNDYYLHPTLPFISEGRDKTGRNHYPETNSLGPQTAYKIAETFKEMLNKVKSTDM